MPIDAHELFDLRARHIPGQPRNLEIELLGEVGVREGPGNGLGDDSVDGTVDAARGVPQIYQDSSEIK